MKERFYLFVFEDNSIYEMTCGISLKDAVWEMAKYCGWGSETLLKALKGFESNDIDILNFVNHFADSRIKAVYIVTSKIF